MVASLTSPSALVTKLSTRANFQKPLGRSSSYTTTMSPTATGVGTVLGRMTVWIPELYQIFISPSTPEMVHYVTEMVLSIAQLSRWQLNIGIRQVTGALSSANTSCRVPLSYMSSPGRVPLALHNLLSLSSICFLNSGEFVINVLKLKPPSANLTLALMYSW